MKNSLTKDEIDFIEEQEYLLSEVIKAIRDYLSSKKPINMRAVTKVIEDLKEDIKDGQERDLPSLFYQLNQQYALAERLSKAGNDNPSVAEPYFGYMKLQEKDKQKIILLGHNSFIHQNKRFKIVDWKKAPIAKLFYQYSEDEEYEIDIRDRSFEGTIKELCVLSIEQGQLVRLQRNGKTYIKDDSQWFCLNTTPFRLEGGEGSASRELEFGTGLTNFKSSNVVALLDKEQYSLISRNLDEPLLIIGGAGSGKTTVALHRVALICKRRKLYPNQVLVIVPNKGLVSLSNKLLDSVGLKNVKVMTDFDWLKGQCKKLIKNIPNRECESTPLSASMIKRHESLLIVFDLYIKQVEKELIKKIIRITGSRNTEQLFFKWNKLSLLQKLDKFILEHVGNSLHKLSLKDERSNLMNIREQLLHVLTNKSLLNEIPRISEGSLTQRMVDELILHSSRQILEVEDSGDSYSESTIDGKGLNYGTSFETRGTVDVEDYALMLCLLKKMTGRMQSDKGSLKTYPHLVLDEVQELSPAELSVFRQVTPIDGNVTIAGDAAQQIDKSISFSSWEGVLKHLGIDDISPEELTVSYRSPKSIVEFTHHVLGEYAPKVMPKSLREGAPVKLDVAKHRAQISMTIYEGISDLLQREPKASIAVICNKKEIAKNFYEELKELDKVRHVEDADFSFKPGVDVTTVEQIRGLEFDYVIIPDADSFNYGIDSRSRKRLHIASTRAIHQLWILYSGSRSLLLSSLD